MKAIPQKRTLSLVLLYSLVLAVLSIFPQRLTAEPWDNGNLPLFDQNFGKYLRYSFELAGECFSGQSPAFMEYVSKDMANYQEYLKRVAPFGQKVWHDPNYGWDEYNRDIKPYWEEYKRKSLALRKEFEDKAVPIQDAYNKASAELDRAYRESMSSGKAISQSKFNRIMREFYRRSKEEIASSEAGSSYRIPDTYRGEAITKRMNRYSSETGIYNRELLNLYASADRNGDDSISFRELEEFQKQLFLRYSYIVNNTALPPDDFIRTGGGDCEDWAILTAGLLRFWDISAYIGVLSSGNPDVGHALCLIRYSSPPDDMACWEVTGTDSHNGYYIPIDYQFVGELSNSLFDDWALTGIHVPENLYHQWM